MASLKQLEAEISKLKERNKKVEADKAWETSWVRKIFVLVLTYFVVVTFFIMAELPKPFLNSIVPALAFFVSTLTLGFVRKVLGR